MNRHPQGDLKGMRCQWAEFQSKNKITLDLYLTVSTLRFMHIHERFVDILITSRSRIGIYNSFFKSLRVLSYVFIWRLPQV